MKWEKIPSWFIVGILIYPLLVLIGLIFSFATSGEFNFMYWLIIPSLMFDQLFKECCTEIASNPKLILLSGFIFWFFIGAILGLAVRSVNSSPIISKEEIKIEEKREEEINKPQEEVKPEEKKEEIAPSINLINPVKKESFFKRLFKRKVKTEELKKEEVKPQEKKEEIKIEEKREEEINKPQEEVKPEEKKSKPVNKPKVKEKSKQKPKPKKK